MVLRVRADFATRAFVAARDHQWVASPEPGVERVMLDRIGDELAVATSIVRYRPGSQFAAHVHDRGEEFLVLDGVFADENGSYPAGTYVRNPPGSKHTPRSEAGCTLFVKLRQFSKDDRVALVIDTSQLDDRAADGPARVHVLHRHGAEEVMLIDGAASVVHQLASVDVPREFLVVSGLVDVSGHRMEVFDWLRLPAHHAVALRFEAPGRVFVKTRTVKDA